MGNKVFRDEVEYLLSEFIKATNEDIEDLSNDKIYYINKFSDLPKFCMQTLKKENFNEKWINNEHRLHLLCRLLSYQHKIRIICRSYYKKLKKNSLSNDEQQINTRYHHYDVLKMIEDQKIDLINTNKNPIKENKILLCKSREIVFTKNQFKQTNIMKHKPRISKEEEKQSIYSPKNFNRDPKILAIDQNKEWKFPSGVLCKKKIKKINTFFHHKIKFSYCKKNFSLLFHNQKKKGIIFSHCHYSDHFSIINVCKKWRSLFFDIITEKYEKSISFFKCKKVFSKIYLLQDLVMVDKKDYSSHIAKNLEDKKKYRVDIFKIDSKRKRVYKLLKKIHFCTVMHQNFFPKVMDVFYCDSKFKIVTEIDSSVSLLDLQKYVSLQGKKFFFFFFHLIIYLIIFIFGFFKIKNKIKISSFFFSNFTSFFFSTFQNNFKIQNRTRDLLHHESYFKWGQICTFK